MSQDKTAAATDAKMRLRAAELAALPLPAPASGHLLDVCVFRLGAQLCAVEAKYVSNVFVLRGYTPIPCVPSHILGVVSIRGIYLTVLDLARFFRQPVKGLNDFSKVLILSGKGREFGIVTDEVLAVSRIGRETLQHDLATLSETYADYALGVTGDGILLLDALRLLESPALRVHVEF